MRGGGRRVQRLSDPKVALIAIVILVPLIYMGFTKSIPFTPHYEINAVFESANNIKKASPVRIAGVEVGRVTDVQRVTPGSQAVRITMRIGKSGLPIHSDATAKIRPRIFLEGNFFVDLSPGTPTAKDLKDGDTIPVNQTSTPVQFDQLLTSLQSDTRDDLKTLLKSYGDALDKGGAEGFNRSIPYWKPAFRDTAIVNDATLGTQTHDLSGYIASSGATAAALDRSPTALKSLVTDFNTTANAFAVQQNNLRLAIAELPRTLNAAMPALASLNASFPSVRAFAREFRPGVRSSGPALDASIPLVHQLRGLVSQPELRGLTADLRPTIPALARLSKASIPLSAQGRAMASCQNNTVLPWSHDKVQDDQFPANGPVYQEAPKAFPGLAGESRSGDANGQWFRVLAAGGTNLVQMKPGVFATTTYPILGANPPKPTKRPPLDETQPCEDQQTPDLRSQPSQAPPQHQADTSSPAFKARYDKARSIAIDWLKKSIKDEGLSSKLSVSDQDATKALIDKVAVLDGKVKTP
ncbi:MAG: phospholipid/cholesterol/gamma-HCH transport system substrate-binding protein [Solirubrobacteraceae bacterium]|nr:phospholipid/cholesterol/gamma-HCH transport system substrate-binding protein [Solirubrobacteraceae bacterium]